MRGVEFPLNNGICSEEPGIVHRHIQHVGDAHNLVNLHRLWIIVPLALLGPQVRDWQEMHLI